MEVNLNNSFDKYFPYKEQREQQTYAIQKVIEAFMNDDKRFVILEAGTGVGKSAIGLTVARYINRNLITSPDDNIGAGSMAICVHCIPLQTINVVIIKKMIAKHPNSSLEQKRKDQHFLNIV